MAVALECSGTSLLHLGQGWFQWIDVRRFRSAWVGTDAELLAALLVHHGYRDHYLGPGDERSPAVHGPYRLECITPDSFVEIRAADAASLVADRVQRFELPERSIPELRRLVLGPIEEATSIRRLSALGESAYWEFGLILDDFEELVVLNEYLRTCTLVVMAGD